MNVIWRVAWREYRTRLTSPLYLIMTSISFILLVGVPVAMALVFGPDTAKPLNVSVLDSTGWMVPKLQSALIHANSASPVASFQVIPDADEAAVLEQVKRGKADGLLILEGTAPETVHSRFYSSSALTLGRAQEVLQPAIRHVVQDEIMSRSKLDPALINQIKAAGVSEFIQMTTGEAGSGYAIRITIAVIFNMLIYLGIIAYASMTFQGVLEEKTSRVMEVLISTVKPETLLAGKVLGIGLAGITQLAAWGMAYLVLLALPLVTLSATMAKLNPLIFVYMFVYFVLGFFFFASLFAALASTISRIEDQGPMVAPMNFVIMLAYFASLFVLQNPTGSIAAWMSMIPVFAPMVMITRLALSSPPPWQIAVSLSLLGASTVIAILLAGRVYRLGVLLYGSRPTWANIWRYLETGDRQKPTSQSHS